MGAGINSAVECLIDLVIALRVATLNHHAQLVVDTLECASLDAGHSHRGKAGTECLEFSHGFEHTGKLLRTWPRDHGGTVSTHLH